jgi:hypothetical protein
MAPRGIPAAEASAGKFTLKATGFFGGATPLLKAEELKNQFTGIAALFIISFKKVE